MQPRAPGWAARVYAVILALWFGCGERLGRIGFYVLFALAVTVSVQLVGAVPRVRDADRAAAGDARAWRGGRLAAAWALGALGYAVGLVVSTALDLPSGPVIVWALVLLALAWHALMPNDLRSSKAMPDNSARPDSPS